MFFCETFVYFMKQDIKLLQEHLPITAYQKGLFYIIFHPGEFDEEVSSNKMMILPQTRSLQKQLNSHLHPMDSTTFQPWQLKLSCILITVLTPSNELFVSPSLLPSLPLPPDEHVLNIPNEDLGRELHWVSTCAYFMRIDYEKYGCESFV